MDFSRSTIDRLRTVRKSLGMSQRRLSAELGVSSSMVARMEAGQRGERIPASRLTRWAHLLGLRLDVVLWQAPREEDDRPAQSEPPALKTMALAAAASSVMTLEEQYRLQRHLQDIVQRYADAGRYGVMDETTEEVDAIELVAS